MLWKVLEQKTLLMKANFQSTKIFFDNFTKRKKIISKPNSMEQASKELERAAD